MKQLVMEPTLAAVNQARRPRLLQAPPQVDGKEMVIFCFNLLLFNWLLDHPKPLLKSPLKH
jgi:hypothetical protein